ncbi:hypothetical protein HN51_046706 [Arachis hypogaea]
MAIAKLVSKVKRPYRLWVKITAVTMLGLCFIFVWGVFSNSSSSITTQRESFEDIIEPSSSSSTSSKGVQTQTQLPHKKEETKAEEKQHFGDVSNKENCRGGNGAGRGGFLLYPTPPRLTKNSHKTCPALPAGSKMLNPNPPLRVPAPPLPAPIIIKSNQ